MHLLGRKLILPKSFQINNAGGIRGFGMKGADQKESLIP